MRAHYVVVRTVRASGGPAGVVLRCAHLYKSHTGPKGGSRIGGEAALWVPEQAPLYGNRQARKRLDKISNMELLHQECHRLMTYHYL